MRIVMVTPYWNEIGGGGINTYVTELTKEILMHANNKVNVVFYYGNDQENYKINDAFQYSFFQLLITLKKLNPDVIHVHENLPLLLISTIYRILVPKSVLFYTFHTEPKERKTANQNLKYEVRKIIYKYVIHKCDCVTFVSKNLKKSIMNNYNLKINDKSVITYAGVYKKNVTTNELANFKTKYGINENDIVILAQGMISFPGKIEGTKLLFCAVKSLLTKHQNIKLLVTRNSKHLDDIKKYVKKLGISNSVVFTGELKNPYVALKVTDIYCHITFAEGGVSLSLLEAMIMRKAIIASKVGGVPEAINETNAIFVELNPKAICSALEQLIDNRDLAQSLGEKSFLVANSNFRWSKTCQKLLNAYEAELSKQNTHS